jgi:hypothetical protein
MPPANRFELSSANDADRLVMQVVTMRECDVELAGAGLSATHRVYDALGFEGFAEFFADIASSWKGWDGEKRWSSREHNFIIRARSDRTGHIHFMARLEHMAPYDWAAELAINVEAGQLHNIAGAAASFARALATAGS